MNREIIRRCADCSEEVHEIYSGDEGWTYCPGCENIEGPTYEEEI